jgi:hypothetical protein
MRGPSRPGARRNSGGTPLSPRAPGRPTMSVLQRFLKRTLVILALAIIGLVFANALNDWVLTR